MTTRPDAKRGWGAVLPAVVPLVLGVTGGIHSVQLGLGALDSAGAGLWPLLVSAAMVFAAVLLGIELLRSHDSGIESFSDGAWTCLLAVVAMVAFTWLFTWFGLIAPMVLVLVPWFRFLSHESWFISVVAAITVTAVMYLLFAVLLEVPLPVAPALEL